jgi:hypothetical protein
MLYLSIWIRRYELPSESDEEYISAYGGQQGIFGQSKVSENQPSFIKVVAKSAFGLLLNGILVLLINQTLVSYETKLQTQEACVA